MISEQLLNHVIELRRAIHRRPGIGFDLPETVALVKKELDKLGIEYTEKYAPCSVVAFIGKDPARRTLAVRADMDALPVEEKVDLPFKSELPGKMHACGHDTHTAILLGLAAWLKEHEQELQCNVRLFFQPAEECEESGAEYMVNQGAMDGVDCIICTHCEPSLPVNTIGYAYGDYMAACMPIAVRFYGKTSHAAAAPEKGINAIKMGVEAFHRLEDAVRETFGEKKYIWNVGVFRGGTAHNVIADYCELIATFRYYDHPTALVFREKAISIVNEIANRFGGRVEIDAVPSCMPVRNDPGLVKDFVEIMKKEPEIRLTEMPPRMSSEDFSWFLSKKPGFIFRYGIRMKEDEPFSPAHSNTFCVNEEGFRYALITFIDYIRNFR